MKQEYLIWLLAAAAGATPILGGGLGSKSDSPGLRFDNEGHFQISVFSDLHLGDGDKPNTDDKTIGVLQNVLSNEQYTNLAVLNGDLLSCEWVDQKTSHSLLDKIMEPFIRRNLPFTSTFGNHDMSKTCSTRDLADYMWATANKDHQLTFTSNWVNGEYKDVGTSNYYVPIYSASGGELKMVLWFFDSMGGPLYTGIHNSPDQGQNKDYVDERVISWFKATNEQIRNDNGGKAIPSLVFVHIPPSVTKAYQKSNQRTETAEPGVDGEIMAVQADNTPGGDHAFMQALVETEGLMAAFSGHCHRIDWCMKYSSTVPIENYNPQTAPNNMHLCFDRHAGYGGYSDWERGSRQIIISEEDMRIDTYMRMEGGRISGRVTLNSTYGTDQYPAVDN